MPQQHIPENCLIILLFHIIKFLFDLATPSTSRTIDNLLVIIFPSLLLVSTIAKIILKRSNSAIHFFLSRVAFVWKTQMNQLRETLEALWYCLVYYPSIAGINNLAVFIIWATHVALRILISQYIFSSLTISRLFFGAKFLFTPLNCLLFIQAHGHSTQVTILVIHQFLFLAVPH